MYVFLWQIANIHSKPKAVKATYRRQTCPEVDAAQGGKKRKGKQQANNKLLWPKACSQPSTDNTDCQNTIDLPRLEGDQFCTDTRTQCFTAISVCLWKFWHIIKAKTFIGIQKVQDFIWVSRIARIIVANPEEWWGEKKKKKKAEEENLQTFLPPGIDEFSTRGSQEEISQKANFQIATSCETSCPLLWSSWRCLLPVAEGWPASTLDLTCSGDSPCPIDCKVGKKNLCCHTRNYRQIYFKRQGYPFLLPQ